MALDDPKAQPARDGSGAIVAGASPSPVDAIALVSAVVAATQQTGDGGQAIDPVELLHALTVLRGLREEMAAWEPHLIAAARRQSVSWASLAPALGVTSRQAAERRYLRLRPSLDGALTGEERVRAERTRRASERAVSEWARENSAPLRQLAGQVSALEGLAESAQHRVDLVHAALAGDDAAALLTPLADAHTHLEAVHAGLAEQIRTVTVHTEQLRRDTEEQRSSHSDR